MTRMSVEVDGIERLIRNLDGAVEPMWGVVRDVVSFAERETEAGAKPHPVDQGKLSRGNNIRSSLAPPGTPLAQLQGRVYTNSPIVVAVDQGRPAGGRMPPISLIEVWAARHGIAFTPGRGRSRPSGFRMARAIGRSGSRGVEFFRRGAEATEGFIEHKVRDVAREIERRWGRR